MLIKLAVLLFIGTIASACGRAAVRTPTQGPLAARESSLDAIAAAAACRVQNPISFNSTLVSGKLELESNFGSFVSSSNEVFYFNFSFKKWDSIAKFSFSKRIVSMAATAGDETLYILVRDEVNARTELYVVVVSTREVKQTVVPFGDDWQKIFFAKGDIWLSATSDRLAHLSQDKWLSVKIDGCLGRVDTLRELDGFLFSTCVSDFGVQLFKANGDGASWAKLSTVASQKATATLMGDRTSIDFLVKNQNSLVWLHSADLGVSWVEQATDQGCVNGEITLGPVTSKFGLRAVVVRDKTSQTALIQKLCIAFGTRPWKMFFAFSETRPRHLTFDSQNMLHVIGEETKFSFESNRIEFANVDRSFSAENLGRTAAADCVNEKQSLFAQNYEVLFNAASRIDPFLRDCPSPVSFVNSFLTASRLISKRQNESEGGFFIAVGDPLFNVLVPWEAVFYSLRDGSSTISLLELGGQQKKRTATIDLESTGKVKMVLKDNEFVSQSLLFEIDALQNTSWTAHVKCGDQSETHFLFNQGVVTQRAF